MEREDDLSQRFEWAHRWALRQSFGPWAYHHGPDTEPEDWCNECRATYDLGEALGSIEHDEEPHDA